MSNHRADRNAEDGQKATRRETSFKKETCKSRNYLNSHWCKIFKENMLRMTKVSTFHVERPIRKGTTNDNTDPIIHHYLCKLVKIKRSYGTKLPFCKS